jgi:hypothetical protein
VLRRATHPPKTWPGSAGAGVADRRLPLRVREIARPRLERARVSAREDRMSLAGVPAEAAVARNGSGRTHPPVRVPAR